ncbi:MAG: glycoside hydrolase family 3 N-terminal domain-containing protein [Terriglobales bacterium]
MRRLLALLALVAVTACAQSQPEAAYKNARLAIADRVADLMGRMTLREKIGQLIPHTGGMLDTTGTFQPSQFRQLMAEQFRVRDPLTPRQLAILHNAVQRYQMEKTRLGIPTFFYGEALHGFMAMKATMFPMPIGLASTWDPALAVRIYTAAAQEARAEGVTQVFAPDLDLGRDPRWGRTEESFGEDPWLVSRMGLAEVEGLQGRHYLLGPEHVLATAKHFTAHGEPEGGTNVGPANFSERILRQNFLFPFQVAVEQGHVGSIMASYNEIDGIPSSVNPWLLTQVLRQEWGFRGYVTSDGSGLQDLVRRHHTAATYAGAARLALAAGVDFDLSSGTVYRTLLWQARAGLVPMSEINRAVRDILRAKFRLGLFDHPYIADPAAANDVVGSEAHDRLALRAAQESIVLLKNALLKNAPAGSESRLLPLSTQRFRTIAVIGPDAKYVHLGGYSRGPRHETGILQGIRQLATARGARVLYAEGCQITTDITPQTPPWAAWYKNGIDLPDPASQRRRIAQAVATARRAQLAILVVGENESIDREAWSLQHLGDRDHLRLFGDQATLVRAVAATGVPVVVVLVNGRPIATDWISAHVPAILEAWYPGQEGGRAVAQVLFGEVNPSGKLPITIPHTVGDLPDYYDHSPSENIPWIGTNRQPLYHFGFGLSYTTFRFRHLTLTPSVILPGGRAQISVDVTNTGAVAGTEVAEMYIHERASVVAQPVLELRGLQRVTLQPGETRQVTLELTPEKLAHWNRHLRHVVAPGAYAVKVGGSSDHLLTAVLTVAQPGSAAAAGIEAAAQAAGGGAQ